jgi:Ni,Fe-hydrogenase III large subunit
MPRSVIPFGPQHPVLPEPLQLELILEDDVVKEALPSIGYVHRGLEKMAELKDFNQTIYVVERVCGICSFMHSMAYARGIEELMDIHIPERAEYLRVIWAELARLQSHMLWLGLMADAFGFESLFMESWKNREKILDLMEMTTGNRIIISANKVGGVTKDITGEQLQAIIRTVNELENNIKEIEKVFVNNYTVKQRTVGIGILTKQEAQEYCTVGPVARASGIAMDLRTTGYGAYKYLDFQPVVENGGDSYTRIVVRIREIFQSFDLIRQAISKLPQGELSLPVKGFPNGSVVSRVEQPRGEAIYYITGNNTKNLARLKIRTPTFANIPALIKMLPGCTVPDVPVLVLTIDPCISCTER